MWITINKDFQDDSRASSTQKNPSLARQIYTQIRYLILEGKLKEGDKIPSSRELAKDLDVSRNTILEAYNQLIAEGYLDGIHGSGTVVAKGISNFKLPTIKAETTASLSCAPLKNNSRKINFQSGIPDLHRFPKKEFAKLYQVVWNELPDNALRYQSAAGILELRQAIVSYLYRSRGINCSVRNLMIVSGATQGLSLLSKLLYDNDRKVIMENPTHDGLMQIIAKEGYQIVGVRSDDYGLNTDLLEPSNNVSFVYTTPSHQYPLGGILPIQRRIALVEYAMSNGCYIVEDDYDSEFRYEGQPVSSLYEMNPEKVIYIGSFSKILSPSLRIGYMLLPDELIAPYLHLKQHSDVHTEAITQFVLAKFIENGGLERHLWKMKKVYARKRQHLIDTLHIYLPDEFELKGHAAGLHIIVRFHHITFTEELLQKINRGNVKVYSIEKYEFQKSGIHSNEILLGYGHLEDNEITEGIKILSEVIYGNR